MTDTKPKKFALVLTSHRLWGMIFLPYILQVEPGKKYFRLNECLSPYQSDEALKLLDHNELELVRIINEYTDRSLFRIFSKDKSVKDFLEKVTAEKIGKFIRPYIETRIWKCFIIARDEGIQCYQVGSKSLNVHSSDELKLRVEAAKPLFRFDRNPEGSTYKLKIEVEGKPVELFHNPIEVLSNSPCIIVEGHRLMFIEDIDGTKLKPFISKENVRIPKTSEIKYFSGFVLNTINNFKVEASGFEISEPEPEKSATLSLESSIKGHPVLILSYYYSGIQVTPDDNSEYVTVFGNSGGNFTYRKYKRDFKWESKCMDSLYESGFITDDSKNFFVQNTDSMISEDIYEIIEAVNRNYDELIKSGFTLNTKKLDRNYSLKPVNIEIINTMADDWFDLKAVIRIDKWEIPFVRFKHNILEGIRDFELPDGAIAILPQEWFTKYRNLFEFGKSTDDLIKIHKQHFSILSEILDNKESDGFRKLEKLLLPEKLPIPVKPEGLNCNLRDYQLEGLSWLQWLQSSGLGGCLADDMGVGKTIQTLALLQHNKETLPAGEKPEGNSKTLTLFDIPVQKFTSIIIVPATLVYNWENEIRRFIPGMKVYCHKGPQRTRTTRHLHYYDIVISSYHTVRQDIDLLSSFRFHYIILDESQVVKNPSSMIYKSVIQLRSEYKLVLTGTPVENSLTDLWAQLNFINPGLLGSLSFFRREFARPLEKLRDDEKESHLRKLISPFILRRTKEMVARDLPPVTEQTVYCEMTEDQNKIYEEEKSAVRNTLMSSINESGKEKSSIMVLQGLMKLRQISNHPVIADEEYTGGSGKFETVLNDIENVVYEGHKILVFSSFVKHLKLFATSLEEKNISYSMLTGASTDREKIIV